MHAVSINKSQGQQYIIYEDIILLFDTTHQAFTHGHLYVALSRITKYNRIICFFTFKSTVITEDENDTDQDKILLQNIVCTDLLQSIT